MSIVKKIDAGITLEDSKKYIGNNFIARLPLFKYEKTKLPENNVCLFIDLLSDGTGDFGWAKEYIDLLLEYGYTKDKIFVFGLASKVFNESGSLSAEFKEVEDTIKNTLQLVMKLDDADEKKVILNTILDKFTNLCDFFSKIKYLDSSKISNFMGDFIKENLDIIKEIIGGKDSLQNIIYDLESKIKVYDAFCKDISTNLHPICKLTIPEFTKNLNILKNGIFLFISRVISNITNFNDANFYYIGREFIESHEWLNIENKEIIKYEDEVLKKILDNSIVLYFSAARTLSTLLPPESINFRINNKIKSFIILQEGGLGKDISMETGYLSLSSGIGERQMGLNLHDTGVLPTKKDIIEILKTNIDDHFKEYLKDKSKYHYAYIGQLSMTNILKTTEQICKYLYDQVLLIKLIDENTEEEPNFLFGLKNVVEYIKNFSLYESLRKKLSIHDIQGNEETKITNLINCFFIRYNILVEKFNYEKLSYKLTSNDKKKHLIVSYFPRLDKTNFLSMIKNSTSPVFSTGDLSTHEALILGKYVIADYIDNKIPMIDLFVKTFNKFCNSKDDLLNLPEKNNIIFYEKIDNKLFNISNSDIELSVSSFMIHINYYDLFKTEVLDKYFIYRDNFKVLLYLANNCVRDNRNTLYLPTQSRYVHDVLTPIDEMNNEPELIKFLDGLLGGKNNYYLKYQKYKLKYLKLKNSYKNF